MSSSGRITTLLLTLAVGLGCGSDVAPGLEAPETLWWEESGDITAAPNARADDDDPLGARYWSVYLSIYEDALPTGSQSFVRISEGLVVCEVRYELEEPAFTGDCTSCAEAWYFVRGVPSVVRDRDDACSDWDILELGGVTLGFGHGDGDFYYRQDDSWVEGGPLGDSTGSLNAQIFLD